MTSKRLGRQTVRLAQPPSVVSYANIGGKQEAQGPLAGYFAEVSGLSEEDAAALKRAGKCMKQPKARTRTHAQA